MDLVLASFTWPLRTWATSVLRWTERSDSGRSPKSNRMSEAVNSRGGPVRQILPGGRKPKEWAATSPWTKPPAPIRSTPAAGPPAQGRRPQVRNSRSNGERVVAEVGASFARTEREERAQTTCGRSRRSKTAPGAERPVLATPARPPHHRQAHPGPGRDALQLLVQAHARTDPPSSRPRRQWARKSGRRANCANSGQIRLKPLDTSHAAPRHPALRAKMMETQTTATRAPQSS